MPNHPRRIREPVQVYLDPADKQLLDRLSALTAVPRAELLRRGLRRLAAELSLEAEPGRSLQSLVGSLGDSQAIPTDLSARHDEYLYPRSDADATGGY